MAKKDTKKQDQVLDEGIEVEVENNKEPSETEALQAQLNEANEKFLRTLAEYDNYRKRSIKEKEQAYGDSKAAVLTELLPVLDNFERAASNKEASLEDYQKGGYAHRRRERKGKCYSRRFLKGL